jgi:hypothetical protein
MSTSKVFSGIEATNRLTEQTPLSGPGIFSPSVKPGITAVVSEELLISKLKKLMKMNLKNFCY